MCYKLLVIKILEIQDEQELTGNGLRSPDSKCTIIFLSDPGGPNKVAPITLHRCGDSEIVIGADRADDLKPEPRNVHRLGAADQIKSSYGV